MSVLRTACASAEQRLQGSEQHAGEQAAALQQMQRKLQDAEKVGCHVCCQIVEESIHIYEKNGNESGSMKSSSEMKKDCEYHSQYLYTHARTTHTYTMGAYPRDTASNPVEGNGHFFSLIPSALSFVFL